MKGIVIIIIITIIIIFGVIIIIIINVTVPKQPKTKSFLVNGEKRPDIPFKRVGVDL